MSKEDGTQQEVQNNPEPEAYCVALMRPGGNDTALVRGIIRDTAIRKEINDRVMTLYPNIEQVGFVNADPNEPELVMAGGEFCGNATRSTAWLALNGQPGELSVTVSGVSQKLKAGVTPEGNAFAQMPIYADADKLKQDPDRPGNTIVEMEGIVQYINFDAEDIRGLSPEEIKQAGMALIREKGLDRFPAAGVMYTQKDGDMWKITPVVYVRNLDTLFLETACGSGTTALGMVLAQKNGVSVKDVPIIQPTGLPINVSVEYTAGRFGEALISGPVVQLAETTIQGQQEGLFAIQQITQKEYLQKLLAEENLTGLYRDVFGGAPYFESFTDNEVEEIFTNYLSNGKLFVARSAGGVVGFSAAVSMQSVSDIANLLDLPESAWATTWYIADLGVRSDMRRKNIGKSLTTASIEGMNGANCAVLRTAANNIIARALYKNLGFSQIPGVLQDVRQTRAAEDVPDVDSRIFMKKDL